MNDSFEEMLLEYNGKTKQIAIIQGELGELITEISNYFYRDDKNKLSNLVDEIVDAHLMIEQLKLLISRRINLPFHLITDMIETATLHKKRNLVNRSKEGALK